MQPLGLATCCARVFEHFFRHLRRKIPFDFPYGKFRPEPIGNLKFYEHRTGEDSGRQNIHLKKWVGPHILMKEQKAGTPSFYMNIGSVRDRPPCFMTMKWCASHPPWDGEEDYIYIYTIKLFMK